MRSYDKVFFDRVARRALPTAHAVLELVRDWLRPRSVADLGCGNGIWLAAWRDLGVTDLTGVDGSHLNGSTRSLSWCHFVRADLEKPLRLGRRFDLVQCLEVGEHLPARAAATLVDSLTRHGALVLFSAALPGQGGWRHLNEQQPDYWRKLFARHGYHISDCLRPRICHIPAVRLSSAHNTFLFFHESCRRVLPEEVLASELPLALPVPDTSPRWLRLGRAFVRPWPVWTVSAVDRALQHFHRLRARRR